MKFSRCVLDDRVLEVGPNAVTIGGDELHVLIGGGASKGARLDFKAKRR